MATFPSPRTRHELSLRRESLRGACTVDARAPTLGPPSPEADRVGGAAASSAAAAAGDGDDLEAPLLPPTTTATRPDVGAGGPSSSDATAAAENADDDDPAFRRRLDLASAVSWAVNVLLMAAKAYAYWASLSKAVLASLADSAVDLASQGVIAWADSKARRPDPRFPVGAARFELVGVLVCACVMSGASYAVVAESAQALYRGFSLGELPETAIGASMYAVLGVATLLKAGCYWQCAALRGRSDSMVALAEDHLNDVASNVLAMVTALASQLPWPAWLPGGVTTSSLLWFADPLGAILISLWIVARWLAIFRDAVDKLCGRNAPDALYDQLQVLAREHHPALMELDVIRAYAFGARFLVEVEVVMDETTPLRVTHDLALQLQHRIEALDEVERAFVHVDYARRAALEHKSERALFGDRAGAERAMAAQRSGSLGGGSNGGGGGGEGRRSGGGGG